MSDNTQTVEISHTDKTKVPDTDAAWVVDDDIYIPDDGPPLPPMPGLHHPGIGGATR